MKGLEKEELFKQHFTDEVIDNLYHNILEAIFEYYTNTRTGIRTGIAECIGEYFLRGIQHINFLSGEFGKLYCALKEYDKHLNPDWDEERDWGELYYKTYDCQCVSKPFTEVVEIKFYNPDDNIVEPDFEYELIIPGADLWDADECTITLGEINHNVGICAWLDLDYLENNHLFNSEKAYEIESNIRKRRLKNIIDFEEKIIKEMQSELCLQ